MKVVYYAIHEASEDMVDAVGVLDDGRVFWAWGPYLADDELSDYVRHYAEHPDEALAERGAEVYDSIDELRTALRDAERDDLLYLIEVPVIVVAGSKTVGGAHVKRATLADCVEMVRRD